MSATVHVEESVLIARPAEAVWAAIADYAFDLKWRKGLTAMDPDPPGPAAAGTKVHEVVHNMGRDYVADTVVTDFDPGRSYGFEGEGTIGGLRGRRTVVAEQGGEAASFTYEIELTPTGASRLLRPVLPGMVRSGLRKDLEKLRSLLEA